MKKLIIFALLLSNISFTQELNREQQMRYNKEKLSIQKMERYSFWWFWGKSTTNYSIFRGYNEITIDEFADIYGDENLINNIDIKNKSNNKKWLFFGIGSLIIAFAQDEAGKVVEVARIPAIGSFSLFFYYHFFNSKNKNHQIIPVQNIEEIIEQYNSQLLKEI